jgi:hypothetical protein
VFLTVICAQHPFGTSINIEVATLLNKLTAPGVEIILAEPTGSPSIAIARVIGPAVPVEGTATLPPKVTL